MLFSKPVDDVWYAAHQSAPRNDTLGSDSVPLWYADEAAPALGCKLQYQTCDASSSSAQGCSQSGGKSDIDFSVTKPKSSKEKILRWALSSGIAIRDIVDNLQVSSLTSRYRIINGIQGPLPANQWQSEVENWNNIMLASLQAGLVDVAIGPGDPAVLKDFWQRPSNREENYLCKNQVRTEACMRVLVLAPSLVLSFAAKRSPENHLNGLHEFLNDVAHHRSGSRSLNHHI